MDTYLGNHLVKMYGSCGDVDSVRQAYNRIKTGDVFNGNIMIAAYAQNGHLQESRDVRFIEGSQRYFLELNVGIVQTTRERLGDDTDIQSDPGAERCVVKLYDGRVCPEWVLPGGSETVQTNGSGRRPAEQGERSGTALINKVGELEKATDIFHNKERRHLDNRLAARGGEEDVARAPSPGTYSCQAMPNMGISEVQGIFDRLRQRDNAHSSEPTLRTRPRHAMWLFTKNIV